MNCPAIIRKEFRIWNTEFRIQETESSIQNPALLTRFEWLTISKWLVFWVYELISYTSLTAVDSILRLFVAKTACFGV